MIEPPSLHYSKSSECPISWPLQAITSWHLRNLLNGTFRGTLDNVRMRSDLGTGTTARHLFWLCLARRFQMKLGKVRNNAGHYTSDVVLVNRGIVLNIFWFKLFTRAGHFDTPSFESSFNGFIWSLS